MQKRTWRTLAISVLLLTALLVVLVAVRARRDQANREGEQEEVSAQVTAKVEQRALTTSLRLPATYVLEDSITVTAGSPSETATGPRYLTKAPPEAGAAVGPGSVIAEVNYRPILLVAASLPFFRQIRPGTVGGDVTTLQEGLRAMGRAIPEEESGTFGAGTAAAVEAIYTAAGYEPPFTQGTRAATEAVVRSAWQASEDAYDVANAATQRGEDAAELVDAYRTAADHARATEASEGVVLEPAEVVAVPNRPLTVATLAVGRGQLVQPDGEIATLTGGGVALRAGITRPQAALLGESTQVVVAGLDATCTFAPPTPAPQVPPIEPSDSVPTSGEVTDPVGAQPGNQDLVLVARCTPVPDTALAGTDTTVSLTSELTEPSALIVPATALVYGTDGAASVIVTDAGSERRVAVTALEEADGYVAIRTDSPLVGEGADVVVQG